MAGAILASGGIYKITNTVNGKIYVGSSSNLRKRASEHWRDLRNNCHANDRLQKAYNKYGAEAFCFSTVEVVDDAGNLLTREQVWIDFYNCSNRLVGYNIAHFAGPSMRGRTHTDAAKAKMSLAGKGRIRPQEVRDRISAGKMGYTQSEAAKAKMSAARKGMKYSPEARALMGRHRIGKTHSTATIEKMTGQKRSDETKRNIGSALRGIPKSESHRAAMSAANMGRSRGPQPADVIAKRVASTRATKLLKSALKIIE